LCYLANAWNIGAEGQFLIGAVAGSWLAVITHGTEAGAWVMPAMLLLGALAGALYALVPAILKVRFGASEILTSLMLVYVADLFLDYLVRGPWRDPQGFNFPTTAEFDPVATVPLLIEGSRAVGVEVDQANELKEFRAEREVILSAGAYNSPQILLLSGIGPAGELAMYGIKAIADLPVGRNLQDHPAVLVGLLTDTETLSTAETPANVELLQTAGSGPLTSNIGEAGGFWRSQSGLPAPDIQFHAAPVMFADEGLRLPIDHAVSWGPCLLKPSSRGAVYLRSLVPSAKPHIRHNYYDTEDDREAIIRGVRKAMEIGVQPAMTRHERAKFDLWPRSDSDADIWEHVQHTTMTLYHPVGTCAMGSVVDPELRVYGIEGLRVIDASVMPTVIRGNTNAPTIMIAERAADLIRGRVEAESMTTA